MTKWTMPEWMEPYRRHVYSRSGGCSVEDLMNDHHSNLITNGPRAAFCMVCKCLVSLLEQLHKEGKLETGP